MNDDDLLHQPHIYMKPSWVFELDKHDSLLVLTELRAKEVRQYLKALERAEDYVLEKSK